MPGYGEGAATAMPIGVLAGKVTVHKEKGAAGSMAMPRRAKKKGGRRKTKNGPAHASRKAGSRGKARKTVRSGVRKKRDGKGRFLRGR